MLVKRIIPILLLQGNNLVKTMKFKNPNYIGDPINTVRIFNELEVDELMILNIDTSINKDEINFALLKQISKESFVPLSYGGGINNLDQAKKIFDIGFEKICINTNLFYNFNLIKKLSEVFGSQAIVASIDVKKNFLKKKMIWNKSLGFLKNFTPSNFAKSLEKYGVGEILLTSVDNEGTWNGLDTNLINEISESINIPLIAHGGVGTIEHIKEGLKSKAYAVGLGNFVVYQKKDMGVLINFPDMAELQSYIKI